MTGLSVSSVIHDVLIGRGVDSGVLKDEGSLVYLSEVIQEPEGDVKDVQELLEAVMERELTETESVSIYREIVRKCKEGGFEMEDWVHDSNEDDGTLKELTEKQLAKLNTLDDEKSTHEEEEEEEEEEEVEEGDGSAMKSKKTKKGKSKSKSGKKTTTSIDTSKLPKEGEFATKRFEKYHKTWMGQTQWQRQDYAIADKVEELDDDDYSSAWLETLRLGVPWGGRGAGGRGVQRVTGESKDVNVQNVTMARGGKILLNNSTLKMNHGARIALVGRNGSGKTTLLRRIAMGMLPGFPPWLNVAYLPQHIDGTDMVPVQYVVSHDFERTRLMNEEEIIMTEMENVANDDQTMLKLQGRLSEIYGRLEQIDAYNAEMRAEKQLRDLGFPDKYLDKPTKELSGGWRMRCALAGNLFMKPDILLMDEPTNALDVLGVKWLEDYLTTEDDFTGTVMLISHDRAFINNVTTETIVLRKKQLTYFPGPYDEYRSQLEMKRKGQQNLMEANEKKKQHLREYISTQQKASKNKKTKGGDQKKQKQIRSKVKQMERIDRNGIGTGDGKKFKISYHYYGGIPLALDYDEKPLNFKFPDPVSDLSNLETLIQIENVTFGWSHDQVLIENFSAEVRKGSRIGIVGQNGIGKSTLLQVLLENLKPISGTVKNYLPSNSSVGSFAQDMLSKLPKEMTPCELILSLDRSIPTCMGLDTEEKALTYLGSFGIGGEKSKRKIETLSGGEQARLVFAVESYNRPSLYVHDESTAHLDLESIDVLTDAIKKFNGTILLVSHDRAFLASVCTELWVLDSKAKRINVLRPNPDETKEEFVHKAFDDFYQKFFYTKQI